MPPQSPWRRRAKMALIVNVAWVIVLCSVAECHRVSSASMTPTLRPGDRVLVNRLAYGLRLPFQRGWLLAEWGGPRKGDVIVFASPLDGKRLVKRVSGVPGDRVECPAGRVWVVPPRRYFVTGDNSGQSLDSRSFGWVARARIYGRVMFLRPPR